MQKDIEMHNLAKILDRACFNRKFVYVFEDGIIRLLVEKPTLEAYKYIYILELPRGFYQRYTFVHDPKLPKKYRFVYSDKTQIALKEITHRVSISTSELLEELVNVVSDVTIDILLFNINEI